MRRTGMLIAVALGSPRGRGDGRPSEVYLRSPEDDRNRLSIWSWVEGKGLAIEVHGSIDAIIAEALCTRTVN